MPASRCEAQPSCGRREHIGDARAELYTTTVPGSAGAVHALSYGRLVVMASATSDVLRGLSVALQLIGIALLLLGVAEVRSWLDRTADASHTVRRTLVRRLELQVENVRHWYAKRRGRPFHMVRHVGDTISISDSATATIGRAGPHPEGLSDHERLIRSRRLWAADTCGADDCLQTA